MTRNGERIALMVVDLQIGMMDGVKFPPLVEHQALLAKAKALIAWARDRRHLVVFIRHDGKDGEALEPGAPGWPLHPALGWREEEPVFSKSVGDAFSQSQLAGWLRSHGVGDLSCWAPRPISASAKRSTAPWPMVSRSSWRRTLTERGTGPARQPPDHQAPQRPLRRGGRLGDDYR